MAEKKPHAVFIPYPLQGHVIPSVHLAIKLASQGFTITFINTDSVHHHISQAYPDLGPDIFSNIRESSLNIRYLTISDGLPIGLDRSLNHDQFMSSLLHVFSAHVEVALSGIIASGEKVTCLIADTFFVWPSKIAKRFGLIYVSFWTEPALVFSLYFHVHLLRQHGHFGCLDCKEDTIDYIPGVRGIEVKDTMSYLQTTNTTTVCHQIIFTAFQDVRDADFIICNSVQELEADTISALQDKLPFYATGPIFPAGFTNRVVATSLWSESDCSQWLNNRPPGSVLYVSFGSYAHLTKRDLLEIAAGLAQSNVSFIWVLRSDIVSSNDTNPLPEGYEEEVRDRAMIVRWCCQPAVLAHPSIGGFLTHCGWNSILESIWCSVPLLCFPLYTDQFTNRKLVVDDWKIGINLSSSKSVCKEEVGDNIKCLMNEDSGEKYRNSVGELKKVLENALSSSGSSQQNMNQVVGDIKAQIRKRNNLSVQ